MVCGVVLRAVRNETVEERRSTRKPSSNQGELPFAMLARFEVTLFSPERSAIVAALLWSAASSHIRMKLKRSQASVHYFVQCFLAGFVVYKAVNAGQWTPLLHAYPIFRHFPVWGSCFVISCLMFDISVV